ncbi:MAG TPA: aminotransferase class III-fold pyridoxal phosphate-dependent enzyme [Streptosporangiaceae bacterium]|nr:aminotransferase class III-fold pyridoxal phosphate-dependent enzyme [Streptosporangiaceae bacterium]
MNASNEGTRQDWSGGDWGDSGSGSWEGQGGGGTVFATLQDMMSQRWFTDLFSELAERHAGSAKITDELRGIDAGSQAFWPFLAAPFQLAVGEALGCRITDVDGNTYLDCHMGFGAQALHGHSPAPVVEFVRDRLHGGPGNGYLTAVELDLAGLLRDIMPHCDKFAFQHSGTEATYAAIRLARAFTGRRLVAKFEGTLHGSHDLAVHNTAFWYHGQPAYPFPAVGPDGVSPVPAFAGVPQAGPEDLLVLPNDPAAAIGLINAHAAELACVIAEPAASSFPFEDVTIPMVKETAAACRRAGVPFILDEVLTGFRNGIGGAAARYGIEADLYTYGKVISGLGIPLSAVGGRADIMDMTQTTGQGFTDIGHKTAMQGSHTGNYLALCASYASLRLLCDKGDAYYAQTRAKASAIKDRLNQFRADSGIPLRLVGFGDFIGCFQFLPEDSYRDYREFARAMNPALFVLTLMLRKRGVYMLGTPMLFLGGAHSESDVDELVDAVTDSALELKKNGFPFELSWEQT